jgi:cytochrome c oxidase cbb3-type subunit III
MKRNHVAVAVLIGLTYAVGVTVFALHGQNKPREANSGDTRRSEAKTTYENVCASCHGLDGRGGERGPDIVSRPDVVHNTDVELVLILKRGKPSRGMPAFASYDDAQLSALVAYVRELQGAGKQDSHAGDPARGRELFFGKGKCSECHMVNGQGGFFAPDLTGYAARRTANDVRSAIVAPSKDRDPRVGLVTVKLTDGTVLTGIPRNQDNFSVQLQTRDGSFHLLSRTHIVSLEREGSSAMPSDYGRTLLATELSDLVSYLLRSAGSENTLKVRNLEDGDDE